MTLITILMKKTQKIKDMLTIFDDLHFTKEERDRLVSELEAIETLPSYTETKEIPQMEGTMDMLNKLTIR